MDNNIQLFNYGEQPVRTIEKDGQIWFVAKDICDILELGNTTEALRGLDDDELTSLILKSGGQNRDMRLVSESGMYALVFKSRKQEAKTFRKWVTSEVLPMIREKGYYAPEVQEEEENLPALLQDNDKKKGYISRGMFGALERLHRLALACEVKEDYEKVLALDFAFRNAYGKSELEMIGLKLHMVTSYFQYHIRPNGVPQTVTEERETFSWEKDPLTVASPENYLIEHRYSR